MGDPPTMPGLWIRGRMKGMGRMWKSTRGLILLLFATATIGAGGGVWAQTFAKHVVVAQGGNAAGIGRDALRRGGGAVDAAVATAFALAVTHPAGGNIGGGGFLVSYDAGTREVLT